MILFTTFIASVLLGVPSIAWQNPQTFTFDPSKKPGPAQECASGIPRMTGPIPFLPNTPLDDDNIGKWVERHSECLSGNYLNNVEHISWDGLVENLSSDFEYCYERPNGVQECISKEVTGRRMTWVRDILDVYSGVVEVIKVDERSVKVASNGSYSLKVQVGSFQIGHAFKDYVEETFVFNDDGTLRKRIQWTEDDLSFDLNVWADQTLRGMGDYFKVDHANPDNYYQIDLSTTGVKLFVGLFLLWLIVAPIGMVWIAMRYCNNGQKVNKYAKVDVVSESEA